MSAAIGLCTPGSDAISSMWKPGIVSNVLRASCGSLWRNGLEKGLQFGIGMVARAWVFQHGQLFVGDLVDVLARVQAAVFANLEQDVPRPLEVIDERRLLVESAPLLRASTAYRAWPRVRRAKPGRRAAGRRARRKPDLCAPRHRDCRTGAVRERAGRDPRRFCELELVLEFEPLALGLIGGDFELLDTTLPFTIKLHVGDGSDLAANADAGLHSVRAGSLRFDPLARRFAVDFQTGAAAPS